ncbi:hypothetical protein [Actinoplanes sp. RD1]|uniref:hypothetical protein n=1 Tax=Actinoplanes sp. RD1 TaxID=3064538 RepID=UPI00274096CE|nr:hypothetical protein [Actinoplanes sp. RD1]
MARTGRTEVAYSFAQIGAAIEAVQKKAIEKACLQRAIPPWDHSERDYDQNIQMGEIQQYFSTVPSLIGPFQDMPAASEFTTIQDLLSGSAQYLATTQNTPRAEYALPGEPRTEYAGAVTTSTYLSEWSGRAAREFRTNYLDPLPIQLGGQFNAVSAAHAMMVAEAKLWDAVREDVMTNINGCLGALDQLDKWCGKNGWTITLTAVASIATIAAVPLSAGVAIPLALATADAGSSFAVSLLKDDPPPPSKAYNGGTAEELVMQLARALQDTIDQLVQEESRIGAFLTLLAGTLDGANREKFVPKRPLLAGTTDANYADDQNLGTAS